MTEPRVEAELKYLAADERPLRELERSDRLGPAVLGPVTTVAELDRYLDTGDLHLAAARWACRLRTRGTRTVVSLKGPAEHTAGDPMHRRPELEGLANESLDPDAWPPSEARAQLLAMTGHAPLAERFRLEQERTERSVTMRGQPVGTLSLDRARVLRGDVEAGRLLVVELEFAQTGEVELGARELAAALSAVPGLTPDALSKLERALAMLSRRAAAEG